MKSKILLALTILVMMLPLGVNAAPDGVYSQTTLGDSYFDNPYVEGLVTHDILDPDYPLKGYYGGNTYDLNSLYGLETIAYDSLEQSDGTELAFDAMDIATTDADNGIISVIDNDLCTKAVGTWWRSSVNCALGPTIDTEMQSAVSPQNGPGTPDGLTITVIATGNMPAGSDKIFYELPASIPETYYITVGYFIEALESTKTLDLRLCEDSAMDEACSANSPVISWDDDSNAWDTSSSRVYFDAENGTRGIMTRQISAISNYGDAPVVSLQIEVGNAGTAPTGTTTFGFTEISFSATDPHIGENSATISDPFTHVERNMTAAEETAQSAPRTLYAGYHASHIESIGNVALDWVKYGEKQSDVNDWDALTVERSYSLGLTENAVGKPEVEGSVISVVELNFVMSGPKGTYASVEGLKYGSSDVTAYLTGEERYDQVQVTATLALGSTYTVSIKKQFLSNQEMASYVGTNQVQIIFDVVNDPTGAANSVIDGIVDFLQDWSLVMAVLIGLYWAFASFTGMKYPPQLKKLFVLFLGMWIALPFMQNVSNMWFGIGIVSFGGYLLYSKTNVLKKLRR